VDGPPVEPFGAAEAPTEPVLSDADRAAIRAAVLAMPPLSDDAIDALTALIKVMQERRRARATEPRPPT
jgi:hypothetical protein